MKVKEATVSKKRTVERVRFQPEDAFVSITAEFDPAQPPEAEMAKLVAAVDYTLNLSTPREDGNPGPRTPAPAGGEGVKAAPQSSADKHNASAPQALRTGAATEPSPSAGRKVVPVTVTNAPPGAVKALQDIGLQKVGQLWQGFVSLDEVRDLRAACARWKAHLEEG